MHTLTKQHLLTHLKNLHMHPPISTQISTPKGPNYSNSTWKTDSVQGLGVYSVGLDRILTRFGKLSFWTFTRGRSSLKKPKTKTTTKPPHKEISEIRVQSKAQTHHEDSCSSSLAGKTLAKSLCWDNGHWQESSCICPEHLMRPKPSWKACLGLCRNFLHTHPKYWQSLSESTTRSQVWKRAQIHNSP